MATPFIGPRLPLDIALDTLADYVAHKGTRAAVLASEEPQYSAATRTALRIVLDTVLAVHGTLPADRVEARLRQLAMAGRQRAAAEVSS